MFIRHKKLILSGLATVWLGVAHTQAFMFVEDFSTDPVTGGRFSVPAGDASRFVYSGGTLTAEYNTVLPTAKYLHALGQSFTQNDPFTMIFDLKINGAGFFADPNEFAQIAVGAANLATTGNDRPGGVNGNAYNTVTADYFPNISPFFDSETLSPTVITTSNNPSYFSHVNFTFGSETAIQSEFPSRLPLDQVMRFLLNYNPVGKVLTLSVSTNGTPLAINTTGSVGGSFDSDPTTIQTFLDGSAAFNLDSVGLLLWNDTFAGCCGGSGTSVVANIEFSRVEFSSPIPEMQSALGIILGGLGTFLIWRNRSLRHETQSS
ncbi:MAG: hypothetical protein EXS18_07435 [Verrucomicrobiae bacterium]|nr:hypothetical protein [Verrucomicrobiae bacterium]